MKLFQKLLVASTAFGFLTPMAAQASEAVNIDAIDNYTRSSSKAKRFDSNSFILSMQSPTITLFK